MQSPFKESSRYQKKIHHWVVRRNLQAGKTEVKFLFHITLRWFSGLMAAFRTSWNQVAHLVLWQFKTSSTDLKFKAPPKNLNRRKSHTSAPLSFYKQLQHTYSNITDLLLLFLVINGDMVQPFG